METQHSSGENRGLIMLYALSTCVWCRKTKELLEKLNIAFDYVEVDRLTRADRSQTMKEIKRWNPPCSFPSLVIDNSQCIVGYREQEIRKRFAS